MVDGKVPLSAIFGRNQRDFYVAHAPADVTMNELVPLGPTFLLRLKHQPKGFDRRIIVELWLFPDGFRVLEVSTKGLPEEAFQLAAEFRALLANCGVPIAKQTATKTSTALAYFSKHRDGQSRIWQPRRDKPLKEPPRNVEETSPSRE